MLDFARSAAVTVTVYEITCLKHCRWIGAVIDALLLILALQECFHNITTNPFRIAINTFPKALT